MSLLCYEFICIATNIKNDFLVCFEHFNNDALPCLPKAELRPCSVKLWTGLLINNQIIYRRLKKHV